MANEIIKVTTDTTVDINTSTNTIVKKGYSPFVGENGNWFEYDDKTKQFIDTNVKAQGIQGERGEKGENYEEIWETLVDDVVTDETQYNFYYDFGGKYKSINVEIKGRVVYENENKEEVEEGSEDIAFAHLESLGNATTPINRTSLNIFPNMTREENEDEEAYVKYGIFTGAGNYSPFSDSAKIFVMNFECQGDKCWINGTTSYSYDIEWDDENKRVVYGDTRLATNYSYTTNGYMEDLPDNTTLGLEGVSNPTRGRFLVGTTIKIKGIPYKPTILDGEEVKF